MENNRITCPHCGKDITEYANRVTAGRAGRASGLKRSKEYYSELVKKRWAIKKAAEEKNDSGNPGKG